MLMLPSPPSLSISLSFSLSLSPSLSQHKQNARMQIRRLNEAQIKFQCAQTTLRKTNREKLRKRERETDRQLSSLPLIGAENQIFYISPSRAYKKYSAFYVYLCVHLRETYFRRAL